MYARAAGLFLGFCLLTAALQHRLTHRMADPTFRWAAAISLVMLAAASGISLYLISRRAWDRVEKGLKDQIRPALEDRVMALAFSGQTWSTPVPKHGLARRVLDECLAHALFGIKDSGRHRLAQFALQHGFEKEWRTRSRSASPARRKQAIALLALVGALPSRAGQPASCDLMGGKEPDPLVRAETASSHLTPANCSDNPALIAQIFRATLRESLLVRALLSADLKRHARHLIPETIPAVLAENTDPDAVHCLQILAAWKLAVPGLNTGSLFQYNAHARLPFLVALLPYVPVSGVMEEALRAALDSPDLEVRCAAALAAGQLNLESFIPLLVPELNRNVRFALACATSLSRLGRSGQRQLDLAVQGSDRKAAAVAMEVLERLAVGVV